jgi:hypothetical protein
MNKKKLKVVIDLDVDKFIHEMGDGYDYVEIMYGKSPEELQENYNKFTTWIKCFIIVYSSDMYSLNILYKTNIHFNIKI